VQFVQIGKVALHYQTISGPADRPVLVFINSLGTDFRIWRDVLVRLVGSCPLLVYDKRGHGLSDEDAGHASIDDHVDDLFGLLTHLDIRSCVICGLSVGGLIAQRLYQRHPDRVQALILCDTAAKIGSAESWNMRIEAVQNGGLSSIVDGVMQRWFSPAFRAEDNPGFAGYRNMMQRQSAEGYIATCAAIRDADYTDALAQIAVPTLCLVGDQDGATPPDLVLDMARRIPKARYEVIKNAGHIPSVEQPEAMTHVIGAFLQTLVSGDAIHG